MPGLCPFAEQLAGRERLTGWQPGHVDRVGFCDHTAGGFYSTMQRWQFWNDPNGDGNPADAVSVHFAISRRGDILQVLNLFDTAYAQGRLGPSVSWPPYAAMGGRNPNGYLISTEHEDAERRNGQTVFIPGSEWTPAQYAADLAVKRWCVQECAAAGFDVMRFGLDSLAGHHQFDSVSRAECPGRFWRNDYRARLYRDLTEGDIMIRHNSIAIPLQGAVADDLWVELGTFEYPPPITARLMRIELYLQEGSPAVQVFDESGAFAGQVGWAGERYGVVDVTPRFRLTGGGRIAQCGLVGYWK